VESVAREQVRAGWVVTAALTAVGCSRGLPPADAQDIENAAHLSAAAYRYVDADSNVAILLCATQASVQAVIRDQKLEPFDSGTPCQ
jgi:hypothetical protein